MEKVGILVVAYNSREAAIIDSFARGQNYSPEIFVVDRIKNPFNMKNSKEHVIIPDYNLQKILDFVKKFADKIDFGIVGPEKPIIAGIRDLIENETEIPIICPTKEYAIEGSKVAQRLLFEKIVPEVNPRFKVFNPKKIRNEGQVKKELFEWLDVLNNKVAVKPDKPAAGKGVGVWGDHFNSREEIWQHFLSNYQNGAVIVEEKIDGEESSFQAFCDGKHLIALPETRDYKRAFDGDKGVNTGGMGCYKDNKDWLPFMSKKDREKELKLEQKIFKKLRGKTKNAGLRGVSCYDAIMHCADGIKILERNSRPGDPEIISILPLIKDDFFDICFKIIEGSLKKINLNKNASVVTYKVAMSYGGYKENFDGDTEISLQETHKLQKQFGDKMKIYPGAMEIRDGSLHTLNSRTVAIVGIDEDIELARQISLKGINSIKGNLWNRSDIASKKHIQKSIEHLKNLKSRK